MFSDFYDVNARVFRAGEPFEIELKGRSFQTALEQFAENEVLYLVLFAGNGIYPDGKLIRRKVIYRKYPIVFDNASAGFNGDFVGKLSQNLSGFRSCKS